MVGEQQKRAAALYERPVGFDLRRLVVPQPDRADHEVVAAEHRLVDEWSGAGHAGQLRDPVSERTQVLGELATLVRVRRVEGTGLRKPPDATVS